jgi:hypothetical protein
MDAELKAKWVAALRSGEYVQGTAYLESDGKFCCLGVLCRVASIPIPFETPYLQDDTIIDRKVQETLADKNDGLTIAFPLSFAQIADYIEANL